MKKTILFALVALTVFLAGRSPSVIAQGGSNTVIGEAFELRPGDEWAGDVIVFGADASLDADSVLRGSIAVLGGNARLAGVVVGDVSVFGGTAEVLETAIIEGDLVVFGEVRRHPSAEVAGNIVEGLEAARVLQNLPRLFSDDAGRLRLPTQPIAPTPPIAHRGTSGLGWLVRTIATLVAAVVVAGLVAIILPDNVDRVIRVTAHSPLLCLGVGVLTSLIVAVLSPLLVVICIGIPVALVLLIAYGLCALVGWVALGKLVGDRLLGMANRPKSAINGTLIGTLVITAVSSIPCLGAVFAFLVLSLGVGGVVLSRFGLLSEPFWTPGVPLMGPSAPRAASASPRTGPGGTAPPRESDTQPLNAGMLPGGDETDTDRDATAQVAESGRITGHQAPTVPGLDRAPLAERDSVGGTEGDPADAPDDGVSAPVTSEAGIPAERPATANAGDGETSRRTVADLGDPTSDSPAPSGADRE